MKRLKTDDYIKLTDGFDVDAIMSGWQKHMALFNAFCFCSKQTDTRHHELGNGQGVHNDIATEQSRLPMMAMCSVHIRIGASLGDRAEEGGDAKANRHGSYRKAT